MTPASREEAYPGRSVLRTFWAARRRRALESHGRLFGLGHGLIKEGWSLRLTMSPRDGRGFNCYFPMPFNRQARIELTNEGERRLVAYFYIDYET
ncbi:MAG: DUF2961 domain-containing protein [Dehalococcoidia bacterium]